MKLPRRQASRRRLPARLARACETLEQRLVLDSTVVFNEIMYHPAPNEAAGEWIELHNQNATDIDLSGWTIDGGIHFTFAQGTFMAGGANLIVAANPAAFQAATGLSGA